MLLPRGMLWKHSWRLRCCCHAVHQQMTPAEIYRLLFIRKRFAASVLLQPTCETALCVVQARWSSLSTPRKTFISSKWTLDFRWNIPLLNWSPVGFTHTRCSKVFFWRFSERIRIASSSLNLYASWKNENSNFSSKWIRNVYFKPSRDIQSIICYQHRERLTLRG